MQEAKAGGLCIQGQPGLLYLKDKEEKKREKEEEGVEENQGS